MNARFHVGLALIALAVGSPGHAADRLRADISGKVLFFEQGGQIVERPANARVRIESRLGSIRSMRITSEWVGESGERQETREFYIVRGRQYAAEIERIFTRGDEAQFSRTGATGRVEQRIRGKSGSGKIEWTVDETRRFIGRNPDPIEDPDFFDPIDEETDDTFDGDGDFDGDEDFNGGDEDLGDESDDGTDDSGEDEDFEDLDGDGVPDNIDPEIETPELDVLEQGALNIVIERSLAFKADWKKKIERPKVRLIEVGEEFFSADLLRRQEAFLEGTGRGSLAFSEEEAEQARRDAQPTPTPSPTPDPDEDDEDFDDEGDVIIDDLRTDDREIEVSFRNRDIFR